VVSKRRVQEALKLTDGILIGEVTSGVRGTVLV